MSAKTYTPTLPRDGAQVDPSRAPCREQSQVRPGASGQAQEREAQGDQAQGQAQSQDCEAVPCGRAVRAVRADDGANVRHHGRLPNGQHVPAPVDVQEDDTPPAPKRTKRKGKTKNERLEAQAQRLSNRASAKRNVRKTEVVCDNKPTEASPFGTRTEVDAPAPKARAQHPAGYTPPTPISVLREAGYTDVMDMLRAVNMDMMDGGVTAEDIL